ncbi:MAG: hypothetical protein ACOY5Y_07175 [Pseudomonadota bacterium]
MADLLDLSRKVAGAMLFPTDPRQGPAELAGFDALCAAVRDLAADHGPLTLALVTAAYPGFDPFPAVAAKDASGLTLAYLADRWADEDDARFAMRVLEAASGREGARATTAAQPRSEAA